MNSDELKLTWDDLKVRAAGHEELSTARREEAVRALIELERIFQGRFFDVQHRLFWFFLDRSGWRFDWAIWFEKLLSSLKAHPDFPRLIRDLQIPSLYGERMTILSIVEILAGQGFSFALDKEIQRNGGPKKPDLFVSLDQNKSGFFIEVSSLLPSDRQRQAEDVFHAFQPVLFDPQLQFCGRLQRILSAPHLEEVLTKAHATREEALQTGFASLDIPGVLQLALAKESEDQKLQRWAEPRGLKAHEFSGPETNVPEFDRLSFKLKKESQQVPSDSTHVVVIYSHMFADPPVTQQQFEQFVHSIEDEVYRHPQIGYLAVIFSWVGGAKGQVFHYGDHVCTNRQKFGFLCSATMLFKNRFASKPMLPELDERFRKAFIQSAIAEE